MDFSAKHRSIVQLSIDPLTDPTYISRHNNKKKCPSTSNQNTKQVICEKADRTDIPTIDKKKYLVPSDLTVGQFVYVIRKRIKLAPEKAIFIFVDEVLPPTAALMSAIYEEHKDEDGFLYVTYSGENTFGLDDKRPLSCQTD